MSFRATPRVLLAFASLALVVSCSKEAPPSPSNANQHRWSFNENGVAFDADFPRARLNECAALGQGEFDVTIRPENVPINDSPWFAFKVSAATPMAIVVHL